MERPAVFTVRRRFVVSVTACLALAGLLALTNDPARPGRKTLIGHRGASAYAPENTLPAYQLAIEQGADFVEQDLQITRDGVLICLHDLTLERTTNVEEVFPDRSRERERDGRTVKEWPASDFTLAEISRLDAGSWFSKRFKGTRIPPWEQAIAAIRGKAGLFPETKAPEVYGKRGFDMEQLVLDVLRRNGLDRPGADPKTPVIIQSFSAASLRKLRHERGCRLPLVLLVDQSDEWITAEGLKQLAGFGQGLAPSKKLIAQDPDLVRRAHQAGLTVTCWTFRSGPGTDTVSELEGEIKHYLTAYGVDGIITDNPDRFPK
ncbi:MAG: glycerophosphodiester phosphodiesterase family protein [Acidobacteriota bacterium]